jgi:hypothetical protein
MVAPVAPEGRSCAQRARRGLVGCEVAAQNRAPIRSAKFNKYLIRVPGRGTLRVEVPYCASVRPGSGISVWRHRPPGRRVVRGSRSAGRRCGWNRARLASAERPDGQRCRGAGHARDEALSCAAGNSGDWIHFETAMMVHANTVRGALPELAAAVDATILVGGARPPRRPEGQASGILPCG